MTRNVVLVEVNHIDTSNSVNPEYLRTENMWPVSVKCHCDKPLPNTDCTTLYNIT